MAENQKPSKDPADDGHMAGVFKAVLDKFLQNVDDMLPAKVIAYDRATNRAQVQPLIMLLTTENEVVQRAQIASVPVFQIGAGGFMLNFPVKSGDLGWIKANDRDISLYMQGFGQSAPNTLRKHNFSDGVFFPQIMRDFVIDGEDTDNVVLQTLDGSQRVAIWADKIKVTSATQVVIEAPEILLDSPETTITGNLTMGDGTQAALFNGTMLVTGDVVSGTISVQGHTHNGVQSGSGNTGTPNP